uniref:Uncharacterized protein n=1 Tax=Fagus sylvatica TaxID=28930 RepID=A0A2N9GNL1_FAGSY
MVYGKFFRKPFSKTRVRLPLKSRLSTQSLLSLFLALDFADLVTGLRGGLRDEAVERRGGLRDEAVERRGGLRDEASPIWGFAAKRGFADLGIRSGFAVGFATRLRRSGFAGFAGFAGIVVFFAVMVFVGLLVGF